MSAQKISFGLILLLGVLTGLPGLGTDMPMSATSATAAALGGTPAEVGFSLSAFMAGFAGSPLIFGPLSDRFGRKPILLTGLVIYSIAAFASIFCVDLSHLLLLRLLQGLGAGACRPMTMALIRDQLSGAESRRAQSNVQVIAVFLPLSAPTVGAFLLGLGGWQGIYLMLGIVSAIAAGLVVTFLHEPANQDERTGSSPARVMGNYLSVLGNRNCMAQIALTALAFASQFAYVSASPLIMIGGFGLSPQSYGIAFAGTACGMVFGSLLSGWLNGRNVNTRHVIVVGQSLMLISGLALLTCWISGLATLVSTIGLAWLATFAFGLVASNAAQLALEPLRGVIGYAAGMLSFIQLGSGVLASSLVFALYTMNPGWTYVVMIGFALCGLSLAVWVAGREGRTVSAPDIVMPIEI